MPPVSSALIELVTWVTRVRFTDRSFPDCLETGVPGEFTLTWEETKTNVALYAVASAPLILVPCPARLHGWGDFQKVHIAL